VWQGLQHRKAVQSGHLNIQENQIRLQALDFTDGYHAVFGLAYDFYAVLTLKQTPQAQTRARFVVNY
jgi:hypothetical protein